MLALQHGTYLCSALLCSALLCSAHDLVRALALATDEDEDVRGLDVAVHDAARASAVQEHEGLQHVVHDVAQLGHSEAAQRHRRRGRCAALLERTRQRCAREAVSKEHS
jgi:hypothetical protein